MGRMSLDAAIRTTDWGVDVAPDGEAVSHVIDSVVPGAARTAIASVRSRRYRVVFIDCPPALSRLVLAAWRTAPDAIRVFPVDNQSALRAARRFRSVWGDAGLDPSQLRGYAKRDWLVLGACARPVHGRSIGERVVHPAQ